MWHLRLAEILCDYAHERWAAGRPVTPELWRCVGPFASGAALDDLQRVATTGGDLDRKAAALALTASPAPDAAELVKAMAGLGTEIDSGGLTWEAVAQELKNAAP